MSDKEQITGVVESKSIQNSTNPKAPAGHITVNKTRITVWDKEAFEALETGESYSFDCTVKPNVYNGKTYQNYSMVSAMIAVKPEKTDMKLVGHDVYEDNNVKDLHLPTDVIDYIKEVVE